MQNRAERNIAPNANGNQGGARAAEAAFALPWAYERTTLRAYDGWLIPGISFVEIQLVFPA